MPQKLYDRSVAPVKFGVVQVDDRKVLEDISSLRSQSEKLAEASNLVIALGQEVLYENIVTLNKNNPATYIGGGHVEGLAKIREDLALDVVLINTRISPTQQRNLELELNCKVVDRTGIILDIFADRARTKAGKLQVELAQLTYQQSRLVRTWTHLERQRGGLGKTGGPGERQIEIDRRLLRERITTIKSQLHNVEKERALQRRARLRSRTPFVTLVGYTNAGKSTLFNTLVEAEAMAADMVFATLDPLMRKLKLPSGRDVILADTVGFIADLPHELIDAFKATLEELALADLIIHVHDSTAEDALAQAEDVANVLEEIGAADSRIIHVANKCDAVEEGNMSSVMAGIQLSALKKRNIDKLLHEIDKVLSENYVTCTYILPASAGRQIAWLYAHGEVLTENYTDDTLTVQVRLNPTDRDLFSKIFSITCN